MVRQYNSVLKIVQNEPDAIEYGIWMIRQLIG